MTSAPLANSGLRTVPQWNPLLESGMTQDGMGHRGVGLGAAMEPALGERDDEASWGNWPNPPRPQWSPLLESGMTPGR
jgi:hypothetical protein